MSEGTKDRLQFGFICICAASCAAGIAFTGLVCLYRLVAGVWP